MRPMLATPTPAVPSGDAWIHEIKWDGWRVVTHVEDGQARLMSRSGRDITREVPRLGDLVLPDLILDGELVAFDEAGVPRLGAMAKADPGRVAMMLFDILSFDGTPIVEQPWHVRRGLLESLRDHLGERWLVPDTYDDGVALLEHTAQVGLEGVVSKRRDSPYRPGVRSEDWKKRPHRTRRSVLVGGWRPETGSRRRLGAVLVGLPDPDGRLRLLGRVGSGLGGRAGDDLLARLHELPGTECPFVDVPTEDARGATWVHPELVVEVESLGFGAHGRLRQPTFVAVRDDLIAADVESTEENRG